MSEGRGSDGYSAIAPGSHGAHSRVVGCVPTYLHAAAVAPPTGWTGSCSIWSCNHSIWAPQVPLPFEAGAFHTASVHVLTPQRTIGGDGGGRGGVGGSGGDGGDIGGRGAKGGAASGLHGAHSGVEACVATYLHAALVDPPTDATVYFTHVICAPQEP